MTALLDTSTALSLPGPILEGEPAPRREAPSRRQAVRLEAAGRTVAGTRHRHNEDALLIDLPIVAVADGVGGAPGGDVAARCALEAPGRAARGPGSASVRLLGAFADADRRVCEVGAERDLPEMTTTATAALLDGGDLLVSHVGDSRAYRLRRGQLDCLTRDDRLVAELERHGMITAEEARVHPWRPVITCAMGLGTPLSPSLKIQPVEPGDLYLLCTDGLTDALPDGAILEVLANGRSLIARAAALVAAAASAGASDDVTVALIRAR